MAAMCSKEDARDSEALKPTDKAAKDATTSVASEKQQIENKCPTCKGSGSVVPAEAGKQQTTTPAAAATTTTVDIDGEVADTEDQLPPLPSPLPTPHPEFVHCMPPEPPTYRKFSVFTAGSIEMGKAVQWQKRMALELSPYPITVNNPRRGHWDPNATQEAKNDAFRHQVEWELSALEQADVICFFFDVRTLSPVTMVELGLWASSGKVIVCCGKKYWRAGNVHLVCERYNIPRVESFAELPTAVLQMLKDKGMKLDPKGDLIGSNVHIPKEKPKKKVELENEMAEMKKRIQDLETRLAQTNGLGKTSNL